MYVSSFIQQLATNVHLRASSFWRILCTIVRFMTCMLSASTPVYRPLQLHREARARRSPVGRFPGRRAGLCLASSSLPTPVDDWTNLLRIGPQNSEFEKVVTSLANEVRTSGPLNPATGGNFDMRPAEIQGSYRSYTDGRRRFWKGCNTKLSDRAYCVGQEAAMANRFFAKVLVPTNEVVHGNDMTGWTGTGNAKSVVGLSLHGRPDFMCAPASSVALLVYYCESWEFFDYPNFEYIRKSNFRSQRERIAMASRLVRSFHV